MKADDTFFLQRQARKNGLSYAQWLRRDNALYDSLRNVPIMHLRPQEIEYDWYVPHNGEQFAYYYYQRNKVPTAAQTELWNGLTQLIEEQRQRGRLIIYSSLGTISAIEGQAANYFLSQLTEAVRQLPTVFLIISNRQWQQKSSELPENVACFDWVPQPELLYQCNLMITHGGMNSIGDCLKAGVPMLVYPLNLKSDQPGNAARVVAKGWGLMGNLQRDSIQQIGRKVQKLVRDKAMLQRVKSCRLASVVNEYPTMDLAESR